MDKCRWAIGGFLALAFLCSATSSPAADDKPLPNQKTVADSKAGEEAVFEMKEISLYDGKEEGVAISPFAMYGGLNAFLSTKPAKEVKAYPKLNSKQPLYGSIVLNRDPKKPDSARKFYFVFDESSLAEKPKEEAAKPDAGKPAPNNPPTNRYDRLYFDFNRDLDLTNDAAISPMKDPPKSLGRLIAGPQTTVFSTIGAPLGEDPKAKGSTVRLLPVMTVYGNGGMVRFMAATALKGEIRLGERAYNAILLPQGAMLTKLDSPNTLLTLTPIDGPKPARSYPLLNRLSAIREADGEFYRISATPSGDKLTVRPIPGDRGSLELSAGKKDIKPLGMVGILTLNESILPLGKMGYPVQEQRATTAKYRLPVGDYRPMLLVVDYGDLQLNLRMDYTRIAGGASKVSSQ